MTLLVVIGVLVLLAGMLLPASTGRPARPTRIKCVSNLKQIGLAFRIYAKEHGDEFPFTRTVASNAAPLRVWHYFHALSNELQSTKILICPADKERIKNAASDFGTGPASLRVRGKQDLAVSYFLGLSADEARPQALLSGDRNLSDSETGEPFSSHHHGSLRVTGPVAWTTNVPVHDHQGNVAIADGSVQQLTSQRLTDGIAHISNSYGTNANLLLFPQ